MLVRVVAIEKHPTADADFSKAVAGETVGLLLERVPERTTEGATQIGPQRAMPASPAQINAQVRQSNRIIEALDRAGEQRDDGQVEA